MPESNAASLPNTRVDLITAVKTPLGFFVLVMLVVEAFLGGLALTAEGQNQLVAIVAMLSLVVVLIAIVSFFAFYKPVALLGGVELAGGEDSSVQEFVNSVTGYWWETITPAGVSAISFVEMNPDKSTGTLKMKGHAYDVEGKHVANWESVAACVNPTERKIFYYWRGWHPSTPNDNYEGLGEISFNVSNKGIDSGVGVFSDSNLSDMKTTSRKSIQCRRVPLAEVDIMQAGDQQAVRNLLATK